MAVRVSRASCGTAIKREPFVNRGDSLSTPYDVRQDDPDD